MKKLLCTLLLCALALCCAGCALLPFDLGGDDTPAPAPALSEAQKEKLALYDEYEQLLLYLQDGNYDGAMSQVQKYALENGYTDDLLPQDDEQTDLPVYFIGDMQPAGAGIETTVEITLDNWQEYFELRPYYEFTYNGFDEFESVRVYYALVSRDGLVPVHDKCNVTVEYDFAAPIYQCTVDPANRTVTYGELVRGGYDPDPTVETMNNVGQYIGEYTMDRYGEYITTSACDALEGEMMQLAVFDVLRIAGTFCYTQQ